MASDPHPDPDHAPDPARRLLLAAAVPLLVPGIGRAAAPPAVPRVHAAGAIRPVHAHNRAPALLRRPAAPLPLVMLDPGHGGKDPGAIGVSGTYEKHIAIAAAAELQQRLRASGRYRCVMTRTADVFIPLEDRVAIAQGHAAALFVSMHADAIASPAIRGASVYTLADHASDGQTAALAARENSADRYAGPALRGIAPAVQAILADLTREETRTGSSRMARDVVASLAPATRLLVNPSRHAAFKVLTAPDIPSVLVEMGFMSNPADEALLRTAAHRARITTAMLAAIDRHFAARPGTVLAG